MGFHAAPNTGLRYALIAFDKNGQERPEAGTLFTGTVLQEIVSQAATDVFIFSHGWKGDVPAAIDQYGRWIGALVNSVDFAKASTVFGAFRPAFVGVHWPSQPWGDEEAGPGGAFAAGGGAPNPEQLFAAYLERLGGEPEIRGPLENIFAEARRNIAPDTLPPHVREAYRELDEALGLESDGAAAAPGADREGFDPEESYEAGNEDGATFGGDLNLGGLLGPLRQLSYWTMKKRARSVGEGGMHQFLTSLQRATPARIHLMGHSFGTIVVSSMLGGPNAQGRLARPVGSVALVQGAVSLWSYAPRVPFGNGDPGYFSRILPDGKISGPLITTQSRFDTAVGRAYPLASRLHGSASFEPGGLPEFGAIGAFGIQGLPAGVQVDVPMLPAVSSYDFARGKVYNLEASRFICHGAGASGAHSDIAGPEVAHAIWEAAFAS